MIVVAPLVASWAAALVLVLLDGRRSGVVWGAAGALVGTLALTIRLALAIAAAGELQMTTGGWPAGVGITLSADALGVVFLTVSLLSLLAALLFFHWTDRYSRRLPGLIVFLAAGLTGLFLTGDAFNFYVFFEVSMAAAFAMSARGEKPREVRAAFLFITLNLFGSALFLMAIGSIYRIAGTLEFAAAARALAGEAAPRAAGIGALLLAAFGLKLGLFPFHTWLPDVYRDLRPEIAAIFSGALANIGSYGLLRFGGTLLPGELERSAALILAVGAVSILYGELAAVGARSINEVLAYSSIGHAGYILVALGLGGAAGFAACVIYALVTSANKTLLFLAAGLRGPAVAAAFACGAFSLAGVPPFAGFIAKLAVFRSGTADANWPIIAVLVAGSALTFVYLFAALQRHCWRASPAAAASPAGARAVVVVLAIVLGCLGAWAAPIARAGSAAAGALTL